MPAVRHKSNQKLKKRNSTVSYFIKVGDNNRAKRVCQKFFLAAVGVSKHRIITVSSFLSEGQIPRERRGGDRISKKSESKKEEVCQFIGKLRGRESHYNRKKSKRIYLSPELSIAKLQKMYNRKCEPQNRVTYDMFRNIFLKNFNIGFSSPASDVCAKCTSLKEQIKMEKNIEKRHDLLMELRIHRKRANTFYELAREQDEHSLAFCFDLQQVQPLPKTPIGDAFYSHQISFYAFCCVAMSSRDPSFYVWTENLAGRGSTEIGSALLNYLDSLHYDCNISTIRLFCDGCAGQNKNSYIIHTLMFWLKNRSSETVREIIITFPVRCATVSWQQTELLEEWNVY